MYYDNAIVEEVRARNDIVDVVGQVVHLEKKGGNYFGLCPFHNEKTPSFSVSQPKQIYYCFGCGAGGNVFSFVQKYENLTFREAIERLAERANYALPKGGDSEKARKARDKRNLLLEINKEAATWYYHTLRSERGQNGMAYLKKRGLTDETMRAFGLGFAPVSRDTLVKHLMEKGYRDGDIVDAGLAVRDEKSGVRDKFWNRVMFPIQDVNKRVIGFGGRVMGDGEPKYLNSPETLIFDKGRNLYGLMYAKNARKGRIILCEGYMDVIAMHQAGFTEACASLGTAFTAGQASVLKRYTEEVALAYDADTAGTKAALRGIATLREAGLRAKVIRMSPHKDPDEFIKAEGKERFEARVREAENPFFFEIGIAEQDYRLQDPEEATRFHRLIAEKLATSFPDALARENYLQAICAKYHVAPEDMKEAVARISATGTGRAEALPVRRAPTERDKARADKRLQSQRLLLSWLAEEPEIFPVVRQYITPDDFTDPALQEAAKRVYEDIEKEDFAPARLPDLFDDEEERSRVASALCAPLPETSNVSDKERALHEILYDMMKCAYEQAAERADPSDETYLATTIEGKKRLEAFQKKRLQL